MSQSRKIGKLLVLPRFQMGFIVFFLIMHLATMGFFFLFLSMAFQKMERLALDSGVQSSDVFFEFLSIQHSHIVQSLLIAAIAAGLCLLIGSVFVSHKVAGPLYRLVKSLNEMEAEGELKEVHFRKDDLMHEVSEPFNAVVRKTKGQEKRPG